MKRRCESRSFVKRTAGLEEDTSMEIPQERDGAVDIFEYAQRGVEGPHAHSYRVRIDGEEFEISTPRPFGEFLLGKVGSRPCAFELTAKFEHAETAVVEPKREIDLRKK